MTKVFDYAVTVQPLPVHLGGGYYAQVPDLPGCMSDGETPQEAYANAQDAIVCWLEAAEELGLPIPQPTIAEPEMARRAG
jgi:antitoxin HicB